MKLKGFIKLNFCYAKANELNNNPDAYFMIQEIYEDLGEKSIPIYVMESTDLKKNFTIDDFSEWTDIYLRASLTQSSAQMLIISAEKINVGLLPKDKSVLLYMEMVSTSGGYRMDRVRMFSNNNNYNAYETKNENRWRYLYTNPHNFFNSSSYSWEYDVQNAKMLFICRGSQFKTDFDKIPPFSYGVGVDNDTNGIYSTGLGVYFFNTVFDYNTWKSNNFYPNMPFASGYEILPGGSVTPNEKGGFTEEDGGDGDFTNDSDIIPVPPLPAYFTTALGFTKIYLPTITQLYQLSRYMWEDDFIANLKDMYTNPMEAIIGLYTLPYTPTKDTEENIVIGNVSTPVKAAPLNFTSQYVELDFGEINIKEFWGSCLDYSPSTKIICYLPFLGFRDIDTDKVMGKSMGIVYQCNVMDGSFVAYITSNSNVIYSYNGEMFQSLPLSNYDGSNLIRSLVSTVSTAAGMIAGGFTAPVAKSGNALKGLNPNTKTVNGSDIGSLVGNVMNAKPSINVDANISGNAGYLDIRYPYIILVRPRQALPSMYNILHGYPSFISDKLKNFSGYTEVSDMHLENINCTQAEYEEIISILESGVIL